MKDRIVSKIIHHKHDDTAPIQVVPAKPTIGFIDTNLGIDHALAVRDKLDVKYCIASGGAYPYLRDEISGDGFEDLTKVDCLADATSCDTVVFLDCYFGRDADDLRKAGKNVYGPSAEWTKIENDRCYGWRRLKDMGVGVPDGVGVRGLRELLKYIREAQGRQKHAHFIERKTARGEMIVAVITEHDPETIGLLHGSVKAWNIPWVLDRAVSDFKQADPHARVLYIKTSKYRGSKETGGGVTNALEALVNITQGNYGPYLDDMEFLVQEACPGLELGLDIYVNGKDYLRPYLFTVEEKGEGTVGVWVDETPFDSLILDKVLPSLRETDYRGNISFEFFYDQKGRICVHDPCARNPFPCSAIQAHFITNYDTVLQAVASGQNVRVEHDGKYAVQVGLYTDDKDSWRTMRFKDELLPFVGFRRVVKKANDYWYVPGDFLAATGVGKGETVEEAMAMALKVVGGVEMSNVSTPGEFVEKTLKKIRELNAWGTDVRF